PLTPVPLNLELPPEVLRQPERFYTAFVERNTEHARAALLEYAWDADWCEPCAAAPLTATELRRLGAYWTPREGEAPSRPVARAASRVNVGPTMLTRFVVDYAPKDLRQDLSLAVTSDRNDLQARFVVRQPFAPLAGHEAAPPACPAADAYRQSLAKRREKEAMAL